MHKEYITLSTQNVQTKAFPLVNVSQIGDEPFLLNPSLSISSKIYDTKSNQPLSAFHRELFEYNLGVTKNECLSAYHGKPFISSFPSQDSLDAAKLQKSIMGLEFLAMLRTNKDIKVEYENSQELKRMRQSYILHVIDFVCQER